MAEPSATGYENEAYRLIHFSGENGHCGDLRFPSGRLDTAQLALRIPLFPGIGFCADQPDSDHPTGG